MLEKAKSAAVDPTAQQLRVKENEIARTRTAISQLEEQVEVKQEQLEPLSAKRREIVEETEEFRAARKRAEQVASRSRRKQLECERVSCTEARQELQEQNALLRAARQK